MHRFNVNVLVLAVFCVLLVVVGQTLMKLAIVQSGGMAVLEIGIAGLIRKFLAAPYIFLGFVLYAVSAILWLEVLSKIDLSVALPVASITYIGTLLVGRFLFNEPVNLSRIVGVLIICSGVVFVIRS